jgi:surface protein
VIVLATVFAPPLPVILRLGIDVIVLEVGMIHSPLFGSDADLTSWDVSHVTDASRAFFDATTFNQNIGNWDVSKVTNMSHM